MTSRFRMAAILSASVVCLGLAAPSFAATTAPAAKTAKHKKAATHHAKKAKAAAATPAAK